MKKLLIPLLAALALPSAVNAFPWDKKNKDTTNLHDCLPQTRSRSITCGMHNVIIDLDEYGRPIGYYNSHEGRYFNLVGCIWYGPNEYCSDVNGGSWYERKN